MIGLLCGFAPMGIARLAPTPAKRPRYGGTLRVEIGGVVNSLIPIVSVSAGEDAFAKAQIGMLLNGHRNEDGFFQTPAAGPFVLAEWEPGKHVVLAANEDFSAGRSFVDRVEIQMGRTAKDRMLDLQLNKTDIAEISPEDARRASDRNVHVTTSLPDQLIALAFPVIQPATAATPVTEDLRVREAVSMSIDRAAIVSFILQKEGEPAGGLLPQWSSGTAFLFSTAVDIAGAKDLWLQVVGASKAPAPKVIAPKIVLAYDSDDALEKTIAERIVVNARESGIGVVTRAVPSGTGATSGNFDARLMRLRMTSSHPQVSLSNFISAIGAIAGLDTAALPEGASAEQIYEREHTIVNSFRVVPLVWFPQVYGVSTRVRDWKPPAPGEGWPLADVWLDGDAQ